MRDSEGRRRLDTTLLGRPSRSCLRRGTTTLVVKLARRLGLAPLEVVVLLAAGPGLAQTTDSPLVAELKRYLNDGAAIAMAPSRFDAGDWAEVAALSGGVVFVGTREDRIDAWVQSHRSKQTEDFARVVKPFGSWTAIGVSAVALGGVYGPG